MIEPKKQRLRKTKPKKFKVAHGRYSKNALHLKKPSVASVIESLTKDKK